MSCNTALKCSYPFDNNNAKYYITVKHTVGLLSSDDTFVMDSRIETKIYCESCYRICMSFWADESYPAEIISHGPI